MVVVRGGIVKRSWRSSLQATILNITFPPKEFLSIFLKNHFILLLLLLVVFPLSGVWGRNGLGNKKAQGRRRSSSRSLPETHGHRERTTQLPPSPSSFHATRKTLSFEHGTHTPKHVCVRLPVVIRQPREKEGGGNGLAEPKPGRRRTSHLHQVCPFGKLKKKKQNNGKVTAGPIWKT